MRATNTTVMNLEFMMMILKLLLLMVEILVGNIYTLDITCFVIVLVIHKFNLSTLTFIFVCSHRNLLHLQI